MTLSVHGVHCALGEALKVHVSEKIGAVHQKYFGREEQTTVTFSKTESKGFRANIVTHVGHKVYQADATAKNAHQALDGAAIKLAKQLRREKTRIRDSHHGAKLKARVEDMLEARTALA